MLADAACLPSVRPWALAITDIAGSIANNLIDQWRRRGRVGMPKERRSLMIGSDIRYAWRRAARVDPMVSLRAE
jgi:hypothetical protein